MLEYGIKQIITNPTLITKADEVIKLVDTRSHKTRAFVFPVAYADEVERLIKEIEEKKWLEAKKAKLAKSSQNGDSLEDVMQAGIESMEEYL